MKKKIVMSEHYWQLKKYLDRLTEMQDTGSAPPMLYPQENAAKNGKEFDHA